ncbi:spore coat putative kinase YutH [Niallia taxi]|uniref:Spore coat protein YutH n=1 Tax=Niallia taxi TaxID=2499688 RepID=A0A437KBP3_9BACI|nr:spore coat protein YutH [Niallia taxi]MCM3217141.1 spore coat protein YutH [Niallia taxi]MDK8642611.1 spore coat protein YutH [Niallia taxi]MED4037352.1 spore coat protein YutH [Niallia taxi]MED4054761.1 spore coat protein YutH [Niallia taxi]MED4121227.1 spore coat protein YutH [Niallia taxi]
MIRKILYSHYGVEVTDELRFGHYEACRKDDNLYTLIPVDNKEEEEIQELQELVHHMTSLGDHRVSTFLESKEGNIREEVDGQAYCVLLNEHLQPLQSKQLGRKLGKFHYRGRSVQFGVQKISRMGQWKGMWEQRIDQMETYWNTKMYQEPESEFDKLFLEAFPYYMGIAENAIQYLVDTELDDETSPIDSGTVCHNRFMKSTWNGEYYVKNPFDWVFDHCGRDLAEWTRERYFINIKTYHRDVRSFFTDYQSVTPLSSFSWRLIYARLLFPLHFVECVENYYSSSSEAERHFLEDQLKKYLNQSKDAEEFLRVFYEMVEAPVKKTKIPTLSWLY